MASQAVARRVEAIPLTSEVEPDWVGFVGDVSKFTGEVSFESMLRIDGHFSGKVSSSNGTLIVSPGAKITEAVINVAVAKIDGIVEGDVTASKELVLAHTAILKGKVSTPAFIIAEGARFDGTCRRN